MKKLAKTLTRGCKNRKEKLEGIFHFVQSHFKVEFPSRSIFDEADMILTREVGTSAEVTGILFALLKSAGIRSTPVLVPDREFVMRIPDVPMLDWFSHLLLKVDMDGEEIWLDPYYGTNDINCISEAFRGVDGLLIQKSEGELITIPSVSYQENSKVCVTHLKLTEEGKIVCETKEIYSKIRKIRIKDLLRSQTIQERKDEWAKRISRFCPGAVLDTCLFDDVYEYREDFKIRFKFHSSRYVQKGDDMLYLNPNILNRDETAKKFSEPTRIYPIMFDEVKTDIDTVIVELPPFCEVAELPDPVRLNYDFGEFRTEYHIQGNQIIYTRMFAIKRLSIPADAYKRVKDFFNRVFEEDQKFMLVKKL